MARLRRSAPVNKIQSIAILVCYFPLAVGFSALDLADRRITRIASSAPTSQSSRRHAARSVRLRMGWLDAFLPAPQVGGAATIP